VKNYARTWRAHKGRFVKGPDPRRHTFTAAERSAGGRTTWLRSCAELRLDLGLPLYGAQMYEMAWRIINAKKGRKK